VDRAQFSSGLNKGVTNMKNSHTFQRRALARAAALSLVLMINCASPAYAVSTDLSDVPLAVKNSAKPNIMFILDNSGSMVWKSITGTDALTQYSAAQTNFYSSQVNQLYYDPNTLYTPGISQSSFSSTTPEGTTMGNADSSSTGALDDPYLAPTGSRTDLTKQCYYKAATPPLNVVLSGGSKNCSTTQVGDYQYGPIAVTSYYYEYTGAGIPTTATSSPYARRDILPTTASYTRGPKRTDCSLNEPKTVATCTYAQEIQNFANWYSYYRTRILTMKTTMGLAFAGLRDKYRVGFSTINNSSSSGNTTGQHFKSVADFNDTTKIAWFTELYSIDPLNGTPLQKALQRVGEYYSGNGMGYSGGVGADDPVQYSCQNNYAILSTDGFWNCGNGHTSCSGYSNNVVSVGNADLTVPSLPTSALDPVPITGLTAGSQWPRPYYEGSTATSNTLADVAAYYWVTDLRTSGDKATNNVPVNSSDAASWQHMTTFTIGLGADGTKDYVENYLTATTGFYHDLLAGTDNWSVAVRDDKTAIDDLWHAAVNGHGQYFSAKSPDTLRASLTKVLDDIISRTGSASAVAVANADVTLDNSSYASSYNSGNWSGDLGSYPINTTTGVPATTASWKAQALLDAASVTASTRKIVSYTGVSGTSQGIQFQPTDALTATKLSTTQQNFLNSTSATDGANVLAFLRGDRSLEGTTYRSRASRLGDIIDAEPVVVGTPLFGYSDDGYAAFKADQSTTKTTPTRVKTVFQGANDGMLHAFDASDGTENWAYVPNLLFNGSSKLRDLSKLTGFTHQYYVDATPATGDVDFSNTCPDAGCPRPTILPTASWKTLLIGGLGKGGRGYYALNVTTPTASSESDAASKVLWEFPNSATTGTVDVTTTAGTTAAGLTMNANKIGYTYGTPIIAKSKAHGWVALVTSGYNNGASTGGDGHGYLFVLNARTGVVLHVFDTGVGDSSTPNGPSGLAQISGYVENGMVDNTVQYVYGGDLMGNVWRFDLNDASTSNWKLKKLATLVDAATTPVAQPVTTVPELSKIVIGGTEKRFVYVGTGQYLGETDIPGVIGANTHASQRQTMYGLVDDLSNPSGATAVITPLRSNLVQQTITTGLTDRTITSNAVDYSTKKGWYVDLPATGERVNTNPVLALGALVFTSNIPNSDVCSPGGVSWLNMLDYKTGGTLPGLDKASWSLGNVLSSRPILIQLGDGTVKILIRKSDASTASLTGYSPGVPVATRRVSWKEVRED
jgi:type IV pilus assembly protein PilY1